MLDGDVVPYLTAQGRATYARFLLLNVPRAFVLATNGAIAGHGGGRAIEDMRTRALATCAERGGTDCTIYAEDLQVVWHGRPLQPLPPVPGPLIETRSHAFVPDARFIWHGPPVARGVLVWAHGKGNGRDARGTQPPSMVRAFNNAGFDVVRFDRAPGDDYADEAAGWLREGLAALRARGWRTIVAAGQSRGAWNSLQALDTPGLADAVIALSPASFTTHATQEAALTRIVRAARAANARVAVAQFKDDTYVRDLPGRIDMLRAGLAPRVGALLVIDQPEGMTGHGGGESYLFGRRFGPCLLHFVTDPVPPTACVEAPGS